MEGSLRGLGGWTRFDPGLDRPGPALPRFRVTTTDGVRETERQSQGRSDREILPFLS